MHRHIHASKSFELKHWKDEGTQKQSFREQHRHEIGSNKDIHNDQKKSPLPEPKIVIPAVQHNPVGAKKLHILKVLTEKHNDKKIAITLLIVGTGLIAYHFW